MTVPPQSKPRYTLTYARHADPQFAVRFDHLVDAAGHFRHAIESNEVAGKPFGRIYDAHTQKRGKMFPSGHVRWNEPKP